MRLTLFLAGCLCTTPVLAAPPATTALVPPERAIDAFIRHEMEQKRLPAVVIAVVDDQRVVWVAGYGHADSARSIPVTPDTPFRVGSLTKPITAAAVLRLVDRGRIRLDAPVTDYLPDFRPVNPFAPSVPTIRQMLIHRSGLIREPPVGGSFDPNQPTLRATVESLNASTLAAEPGTRTRYSNAGYAVLGRVIEKASGRAFTDVVTDEVLRPLGMTRTGFGVASRAVGRRETVFGRDDPAPMFSLGMTPAGGLDATASDLARFWMMLFRGGDGFLAPATARLMAAADVDAFACGLLVTPRSDGVRLSHSGGVSGFAAEMLAVPQEKLGVVVLIARDRTNGVALRIAEEALTRFRLARTCEVVPPVEEYEPLKDTPLAGLYAPGPGRPPAYRIATLDGRAWLWPLGGGDVTELRQSRGGWVMDDVHLTGPRVGRDGDGLSVRGERFVRVPDPFPPPVRDEWRGLVGEYGGPGGVQFVCEDVGRLYLLLNDHLYEPLSEAGPDRFRLRAAGPFADARVAFERDPTGRATRLTLDGVSFARRDLPGDGAPPFRITPVRPVAELLAEARRVKPPANRGEFASSDLVDVAEIDPSIRLDIRYATADNFLGTPVYPVARAMLQRPAAEALARANRALAADGFGLLVHDAYRPWHITRVFWDATPAVHHGFVADPAVGSRHNRGCAVDLTLYDRATGRAVEMPGAYDEFSDRAYPRYPGGTARQRWLRDRLRAAMEAEGFAVFAAEWWHFDHRDWKKFPVINEPLEKTRR